MSEIDLVQLHDYNYVVSSIMGMTGNFLAIYLVKTQTAKGLRHYSQTLLQNCTIDLLTNLIIFLSRVQFQNCNGLMVMMLAGIFENLATPWSNLLHQLWYFSSIYSNLAMSIPFYCRYRVFCKNDVLSNYRVVRLYVLLVIPVAIINFFFTLAFLPNPSHINEVARLLKQSEFVRPDGSIPVFVICESGAMIVITLCLSIILVITCYITIAWLGIQIRNHLKKRISKMFPKNLEYHYEINKVLIFQAISPLVAGSIPIIFYVITVFVQLKIQNLTNILTMALAWAVVFNPYFAIFMVRIYRRAIFQPRKYLFVKSKVILKSSNLK